MADQKISQLTDGTSFQAGDEAVVNRSGTNFKVDPTQFGSSIDVTGTVTADGLTVDGDATLSSGSASNLTLSMYAPDTGYNSSIFLGRTATRKAIIEAEQVDANSGHNLNFYTNGNSSDATKRASISKDGDISFYEDTGTTPKFYWDASAEALGIGTTSPEATLNVLSSSASATTYPIRITNAANPSADVGVALEFGLVTSNDSRGSIGCHWTSASNSDGTYLSFAPNDGSTGNVERMRIDSSGNLLVGTTTAFPGSVSNVAGIHLGGDTPGRGYFSNDGGRALNLNRMTSDGEIVRFRKDNTTVGSIGTVNGFLGIGTDDTGLVFINNDNTIRPFDPSSNTDVDDSITLGASVRRFKNLYLSGGVYLGGTGAANLLDDYETGTWTPVVADAQTGGNTATGTFSGSYVKVGKLVTIQCALTDIDTTGMTVGNILFIQGLPFSASSSNSSYASPALQSTSFTGQVTVFVGGSRSYAYLRDFSSGGTLGTLSVSSYTSGSADVVFVMQYEAA